MENYRIIIVEDNLSLRQELVDHLTDDGFTVRGVEGGDELTAALSDSHADALIIDLNLPFEDGITITKRIRKALPDIGIVVLTARVMSVDRQEGYEAGADVYITKPAKPDELTTVLRNLCRRVKRPELPACWRLDQRNLSLLTPLAAKINLTQSECKLLTELALSSQCLENHKIIELMGDVDTNDAALKVRIEQLVSRIRQKIAPFNEGEPSIRAIRGKGYKLCIPLTLTAE